MLEPYEWKRSRTVLRRESGSNPADLVDYGPIIEGLGGEVINISATSPNHINAMDIVTAQTAVKRRRSKLVVLA